MRVEIISIGDEMTTGQRLDTNSQWLSQRCCELGLEVAFHTTVGDNSADNVRVFLEALNRADIVVTTGGLGPTADDLTRTCLATVAGVSLVRNPEAAVQIEHLFQRAGRSMPPSNLVQADFPEGSRMIPNSEGTAPGIDLQLERGARTVRFFCLPGVPAEMTEMWFNWVLPEMNRLLADGQQLYMEVIHCFGAGESQIEAMLPDLINRERTPRVGITASQATISLRIQARARSPEEARSRMAPTIGIMESCLGDLIFGCGEQTLPEVLVQQLQRSAQNLAVCDLGLHGLVATGIAQAAGGNAVLRGALTLPGNHPAPASEEPSRWIAQAEELRSQFAADFGVVIGPLRPFADREQYVVTLVGPEHVAQHEFSHVGHSSLRITRSVKQVHNWLRLQLRDVNRKTCSTAALPTGTEGAV